MSNSVTPWTAAYQAHPSMGFSRQEYWSGVFFTSKKVLIMNLSRGFPGRSESKESTCNTGDLGSILGLGRSPGGGDGNPLQYSYLENPHGQRRLVG